jgi:hypothetical protein
VAHLTGGEDPNAFDMLRALELWVEQERALERVRTPDMNVGALVAGFGWRLANNSASRGWFVAPEFRAVIFDDVAGHRRVNVGYRF